MRITVVCVGKLKEAYWRGAIDEYSKRLSRYIKLEIVELPDEKAPDTMSPAQEGEVRQKEGFRILKAIKEDAFAVALAIEGKSLSSEDLADFIEEKAVRGVSHMVFIIGGSLGLSKEVMKRADFALSFSPMTFPHQMMRVILLEQIYRAEKINRKEPYHK
ncbi:23S rRNA (pseudouridine(1915)-N(3))-methyltransferase RlmH [Anaerotignum sp.]|uniref:23S rRNA (pseudouridine(1915)-N(3))-methyltransferase RlmH n=1 Tax=Anaerotignum sp. TaxID=2039241 RepID=UPI00332256D5